MSADLIPVLLMNPGGRPVARRTPPRYKSGPKKGQFRPKGSGGRKRSTKRRASSKKTTTKRRRRRRRNPSKPDAKGMVLGVLGGGLVGAGNYALDGVDQITNKQQALIVMLAGVGLGALASMASKGLGFGMIGAGAGLGGYKLASILIDESKQQPSQLSAAHNPYAGYLGYPRTVAQLSAVEADLGAIEADLGAVEANLGGTTAHLAGF